MAEIEDIKVMKKHLQSDELKNIYLFYGPENYLKDLYAGRIKTRLDVDSMNCYFFGQDADVRDIESICATTSMFGDKKLVVVSGSGMFKAATDTSFADVAQGSDTIVVFKEDDVDKRNKLYKKVCETGVVFQCKKQSPAEIKKVLAYEVKKSGRIITEYVLQYMIEGIGEDITKLMNEIEKLILYVQDGEEIKKEHVDQLCCMHYSPKIFDLNDAVASGNNAKAYEIMKGLLEDKEPPVKIISILSKMWSQLYSVKLLMSEGAGNAQIAACLGIKDFAASKLSRQAANMSLDFIRKKVELCEEMDMSVKSGLIKDVTALELLTIGG